MTTAHMIVLVVALLWIGRLSFLWTIAKRTKIVTENRDANE